MTTPEQRERMARLLKMVEFDDPPRFVRLAPKDLQDLLDERDELAERCVRVQKERDGFAARCLDPISGEWKQ